MRRHIQVFLLAVAFDLYWALVVLFREQGLIIWIALAIWRACCCRLYTVLRHWSGGGGQPAGYALGADGADCLHERLLMPLWMVALWLMFATVWTQLTRTTTLPGWLLTLLAAVGGPVAYLIGERLGAITFLEPTFIVVSWMAPGWLVLMLFFHLLMGRQK